MGSASSGSRATDIDQNRGPRLIDAGPRCASRASTSGTCLSSADARGAGRTQALHRDDRPASRASHRGFLSTRAAPRSTSPPPSAAPPTLYHYDGYRRDRAVDLGPSTSPSHSRWGARSCSSPTTSRRVADPPAPRRARPAADAGAVHPMGLPRGAAHRERRDRLRRRRLHDERRTTRTPSASTWADRRSTMRARRCAPPSTRSPGRSTST